MKKLTLFILALYSGGLFAQVAEIIKKSSDTTVHISYNQFVFCDSSLDMSNISFVATYRCFDKNENPSVTKLFNKIRETAIWNGSNVYKINSYVRDTAAKTATLILDTYFADSATIMEIKKKQETNVVYVLGDDKENGSETYSFKINGDRKEIKSGTFYREKIKENEELKVNKGGITGMTYYFKWEENKPPVFVSPDGKLRLTNAPPGMIGAGFTTGKLIIINRDLGIFLTKILKESKE